MPAATHGLTKDAIPKRHTQPVLTYHKSKDAYTKKSDGTTKILLVSEDDFYFQIEGSLQLIWTILETHHSLSEVTEQFSKLSGLSEDEIADETQEFLKELVQLNLVRVCESSP